MAARFVGSLETEALNACSGTLDGSDKMEVALLKSRNEDNTAGAKRKNKTKQKKNTHRKGVNQ